MMNIIIVVVEPVIENQIESLAVEKVLEVEIVVVAVVVVVEVVVVCRS